MPKVTKVGKFRSKATTKKPASLLPPKEVLSPQAGDGKGTSGGGNGASSSSSALSRGQRKRLAKREQYLKREKMVLSSLRLKRMEDQKKRIDGLDALREALPTSETINASSSSSSIGKSSETAEKESSIPCDTNKSKKELAGREVTQMGLVLQHPSFKSDPYNTIREHLMNTLASQAEEQTEADKKRRHDDEEKAAEKKRLKKERLREAKFNKSRKKKVGSANATKKHRRGR